jgi:DNA-binding MarR family transcriptional regulator
MFLLNELPDKKTMEEFSKLYSEMDISTTAACLRIFKVASILLVELEKHFSSMGLSQARFLALIVLERGPTKQQMPVEIALKMGTSKKNTSRLLEFMKQDGLISISAHESDGRASIVKINAKGAKALSKAMPGYYKIMNKAMENLDEKSKQSLIRILDQVKLDSKMSD